jgi:hypothetical protein
MAHFPILPLRKSYEVVGWSYNGALYCVDHEPARAPRYFPLDVPQPVFLDEITSHDVCDVCFIPLDA